jgi:hypothetical protein
MKCGLRIADCGFKVDRGIVDGGLDFGLIVDWNPRSAFRTAQLTRIPQSALRNDEGNPR